MEKFRFKTNINCNGCKTAVTPFLNRETSIDKWEVDLNSPEKILRVEGENIDKNEIINLITAAGYRIEELP
jgi:copper chaperone